MKRAIKNLFKVLLVGVAASLAWSGTAQAWWNHDWTMRKKITIDTGTTGEAIADPIGTSPVLIRLADFDFGAAKDDGSDIRMIADDDKTPLAFHIEKYDSLLGEAFVWVKVPDLKPARADHALALLRQPGQRSPCPAAATPRRPTTTTPRSSITSPRAPRPPHDSSGQRQQRAESPVVDDGSLIGPGLRLDGQDCR